MKKLIILLLFIPLVSFGQNDGVEFCYKLGNRSFNTNTDAINSLEKILAVANLKSNRFVILPCDNVSNALAGVYQGFRYILYKPSWMNQNDNWGKMAVLAHEVGHHINGHTLSGYSLSESRQVELEADDWAGYAMAKIGASLAQTLELTKRFQTGDDTNSTHPNRAKRIAALTSGWNTGNETISSKRKEKYVPDNSNMSASEYWNRAYEKAETGDHYGAIKDYTKSIELAPNNDSAYYNRGVSKQDLEDYYGAIKDYTKSIELEPNYTNAYANRGVSKHKLEDDYGAIADYTKAIELDPNDADAYYNRGVSKQDLEDYYGAIKDYTKFIELDPNYAYAYYNRGVSKKKLEDYYGAIADYTKAIELDPDDANAYSSRGISKEDLGDLNGACSDWKKAASLGHTNSAEWVANQCN
ncbi:tetratricopeptide repeat protein [Flavobacteriaceae bacterium]|nr:tetratricopeptide repeat protein [Flavobacteriaceae bacterium]